MRSCQSSDSEKQDLLLDLCQCFHPYLMKYLVMICRGHVPIVGHGGNPHFINKDVRTFLMYFLPKGQRPEIAICPRSRDSFIWRSREWRPRRSMTS